MDVSKLKIGMNEGGIFVVDNSALASFYGCTTAAWLRYLQGYTGMEDSAALKAGSAAHKAREVYYKTGQVQDAMLAFMDSYYGWAKAHVVGDDRLSYDNTFAIVQEYLRSLEPLGDGRFKGSVLAYPEPEKQIEIADCLPLDAQDGIYYATRMDGLGVYSNGYAIEEFKTTGMINAIWKNKWKLASQLTGYLWGARQLFELPILGVFVQGLELGKLPSDPGRKCSTHGQKYSQCRLLHAKWETVGLLERPEPLIEGWRQDALAGARKMRDLLVQAPNLADVQALAQEGMFNNNCQWCQFIGMCEMGRQPHLIQANLKVEWWSPFVDE